MVEKLGGQLIERLFTDIERMKPWKCKVCGFMNRKQMIGGLWCLYNQLNECGLCGAEGDKRRKSKREADRKYKPMTPSISSNTGRIQLPPGLKNRWNGIVGKCTGTNRDSSVHLQEFKENEMIQFIRKWIDEDACGSLSLHEQIITNYFQTHRDLSNGQTFMRTSKKEMVNSLVTIMGDNKLTGKVNRLWTDLTKHIKRATVDCIPMKRIAVILEHYHSLTKQLKTGSDRYSCSIRQFLSAFPTKDSRLQLLDDFDHVLEHKPYIIEKQPYIKRCDRDECTHSKRIEKAHELSKLSQQQQQILFHCDDWMDFEYILYLDKIHCTLCHAHDNQSFKPDKERHIIRRYSHFAVYSTGVYIDHSSLSPLHVNFKEEVINNSVYPMTGANWDDSLNEAQAILKSKWKEDDTKWRAKVTNEIYGIRIGDRIQIEHVLGVYLYTSNTTLCTKFRESYRSSEYDKNNQNIRSYHINNFYWMGRFIYTAIQFFGQKPDIGDRFYHGLKQQFLFTEFSVTIEPPTSTTKDRNVAQRIFAGDNGTVLTLKPKFKYQLNNSKYLDVSAISNYGKEEERLFAGMTVLAVIDIQYRKGRKTARLGKCALVFLYFERILEQTIHNKSYYNYGLVSKADQRKYLLPLIQHQMQRNGYSDNGEEQKEDKDEYLYALFEHFCDSKQEYVNLTCINDEIARMDESIQCIFFHKDDKWQINDDNLQLIFPKLKGYINHLGYWQKFKLGKQDHL
eukprot:60907_1